MIPSEGGEAIAVPSSADGPPDAPGAGLPELADFVFAEDSEDYHLAELNVAVAGSTTPSTFEAALVGRYDMENVVVAIAPQALQLGLTGHECPVALRAVGSRADWVDEYIQVLLFVLPLSTLLTCVASQHMPYILKSGRVIS